MSEGFSFQIGLTGYLHHFPHHTKKESKEQDVPCFFNRIIPAEALADMPTALPFVSYQAA